MTSYVEDSGQRMYLDWESNDWRDFPDEWYNDVALLEDGAEGYAHDDVDWTAEDEGPQRVQTLSGKQYDVAMEKGVRMYYSEEQSEWAPMPVALEVMVPSVIKALQRFEAEIPSWSNVNEKVLALRENGYRVDDTIEWKKKEMILAGEVRVRLCCWTHITGRTHYWCSLNLGMSSSMRQLHWLVSWM